MKKGIAFAILAAALYAVNAPFSKILLDCIPPTLMAGFLYVGAGIGMIIIALVRKIRKTETNELKLTKSELPYTVAMILLDIAAPICLMFGLNATTAANASLLNNFEIVATAIIALMIFKEKISPRLWFGILFITVSCGILSFEDLSSLQFTYGSLFVLLAAVCWGFENNCTRKLSSKDPLQIVLLKGIFSGLGSIIIGLCIGERLTVLWSIIPRAFGRIYRIRIEYIFLCLRSKASRCGTDKCLLRNFSVYSRYPVIDYIQANSYDYLFYSINFYGNRCLAFFK